ncbi:hypothetical protein E1193_10025 [Micromonospora sp. KC606]|uniref:hypothetical protein n=1 Tax=Micromonospora sp. KC606 TaxID=2530379 RepID=UPI0010530FF4|nr:hypothetical protein [Micromonospora sp. KC606]TDC82992.1 hypothetical protein E1193_10025 [Micromonospora sp. KC606]
MSDDMDFVERLRREMAGVRWAEPAQLRARARRRSRRAVLMSAAVLAVASAAGLAVAGPPSARQPLVAPPVAASLAVPPAPGRAEIPLDALLQPRDLRRRTEPPLTESGLAAPVVLDDVLGRCLRERDNWSGWAASRYSRSQSVQLANSRSGASNGLYLTQDLFRLRSDTAARFFVDVDRWLRVCVDWPMPVEPPRAGPRAAVVSWHRWEVMARGFAGDEAMLLRQTVYPPAEGGSTTVSRSRPVRTTQAIVRVGDLVTVVSLLTDGDEQELRRLAGVAAARMCDAANPRC